MPAKEVRTNDFRGAGKRTERSHAETRGGLNAPTRSPNPISKELHLAMCDAWTELEADDRVDVAVITGTGDAFCGGMDLREHVTEYVNAAPQQLADWAELGLGGITRGMHRFSKPVVAAVNGWALAGGFEVSLASDIRIAFDKAQFESFEVRRGFHHGDGGIARLVNICGVSVAMEMLLTAEPITADPALQVNLVSRVVPHDALMNEAYKTAEYILRNDQTAVRSAKKMVFDMIGRDLDDQLYRECMAAYTLLASNSAVPELLKKFYDKTYKGRTGANSTSL